MTIGALPFTSLFLASPGSSPDAARCVPAAPVPRAARVFFNDETLDAFYLVIDARGRAEQEEDRAAGTLKGPAAVFFQGHAQRPADAYVFTSLVARLCRSGVAVVPVCDTPFGADEAWRGDDGKMPVLMGVTRFALASLGIKVREGCPSPGWPVLVDGLPVDDRNCPVSADLMALGWSHGGILARRLAHAYPGHVSALGQVCPAGYEHLTPVLLAGRFAREALRISRITAGSHTLDALRSALGFTRGLTGDIARSLACAALSQDPAKALRAARDIQDCSQYCDSSRFGLKGIARIAVIFGADDTCMSPLRVLGTRAESELNHAIVSRFRQRYYADASPEQTSLHLDILPGTHLGPVTHSDLYAKTILRNLDELAPGLEGSAVKQVHWILVVLAIITLMGFRHWTEDRGSHTVTKVFDGDTIRLDDRRTVRLIGVDAPEVDSPYTREAPGGRGSRDYLKKFIEGKKVVVKVGREPLDRYGRTLGFVYLGNVLVNGRIIRDGWARAYLRFDYPFKDLFIAYEQEARARGIGMWKGADGPGTGRD